MNSTFNDILNRRSIRTYKKTQVSDSDLKIVLDAGIAAPSANNFQPWHFTVIQDEKFLDWMVRRNREIVSESEEFAAFSKWLKIPDYHNFFHAPTVILISGEEAKRWHLCDCALAMENMALAAWSISVGSCIVASIRFVFGEKEFLDRVRLPEGYIPLYALTLGYIEGDTPKVPKRKTDCVNYVR